MNLIVPLKLLAKQYYCKPDYVDTYAYRGLAFFIKKDYEHAIEDFTYLIQFKPDNAISYNYRGIALLHLQDWEKAKSDLTIARNMGVDIIALFRNTYASIADFEQRYDIQMPEDLATMLTSS